MALDFTLLSEKQIWGNDALEVLKKYGTKVAPTDLTLLLGGSMLNDNNRTSEDDLTCQSCCSASPDVLDHVVCIGSNGSSYGTQQRDRTNTIRPALSPSETSKINPPKKAILKSGVYTVEYGEYPQTVVDGFMRNKLEKLHKFLHSTGKTYTFDSVEPHDEERTFQPISYPEYELDGTKYIRILGRPDSNDWRYHAVDWKGKTVEWAMKYRQWWPDLKSQLSTGELVRKKEPYWVEVQPIEWLMDKSGWMVAKKCLFAGIQYHPEERYVGDFSKTFMKHYLDTYFAKEMEPTGRVAQHSKTKIGKIALKKRQLTR